MSAQFRGALTAGVPTPKADLARKLQKVTREFQLAIGNNQAQLADALNIPRGRVFQWFDRGRISVRGAHLIGRKYPDWPRERLRPDVINWPYALRRSKNRSKA
jgi:DNA-binding transcriptional regulator YdaS (Cro superfamily)